MYIRREQDHLVSWKVCCHPKKDGSLDLGNVVSKNIALARQQLCCFNLEPHLGIRLSGVSLA